jgi:septum site-determining protein MinC
MEKNPVFQLKGGLYTLTAVQLLATNLAQIKEQLSAKIQQAPKFFQNAPIVIDLQKLNRSNLAIDFKQLKEILQQCQLVPVGVKGGNSDQHAAAAIAGLAILQEGSKDRASSQTTATTIEVLDSSTVTPETLETETPGSNPKLITEPVRSGQQIYAQGGDLIVLAPVSHGAELLADGHIHIYGPLRGRALAGVTGDLKARIFCQSLEAELISIAGHYKISEDIDQTTWRQAVDVYLEEGRLHIRQL